MDRRVFLGTLAGGLLAAPLAAEAQSARVVRMAYWRLLPPGPFVGEHSRVDEPVSANIVISRQRGKVTLER